MLVNKLFVFTASRSTIRQSALGDHELLKGDGI